MNCGARHARWFSLGAPRADIAFRRGRGHPYVIHAIYVGGFQCQARGRRARGRVDSWTRAKHPYRANDRITSSYRTSADTDTPFPLQIPADSADFAPQFGVADFRNRREISLFSGLSSVGHNIFVTRQLLIVCILFVVFNVLHGTLLQIDKFQK